MPEGLPESGFVPGQTYNQAGRWLEQRGWYSLHRLAKLMNVNRLNIKRRALKGQFPYLRVSARSWWVPPSAVSDIFETYGDMGYFREWEAAGKPMYRGRGH